MKSALFACAAFLPILFGVGWLADILTRDVVGAMVVSHGGDPSEVMRQSIFGQMWPALLGIWVVASGIVLGLARLGFGNHHMLDIPPPPIPPIHKQEE